MRNIIAKASLMLAPLAAIAHPGHHDGAEASTGLLHYVTSPLHMIPLTLAVIVGGYLIRRRVVAARNKKNS